MPLLELLAAIWRHRLQILLAGDQEIGILFPKLKYLLKEMAHQEILAALALSSLTRGIAEVFENAGVPMLVLKGVALSKQTTGSLTARGRGDLDLWVKSNQVGEVIALLKHQGFQLTAGASCVGDTNFHGSYSGFVCIEISMFRNQGQQTQFIDLHWHPSHIRGIFPPFDAVWNQREKFYINEQQIFTLPLNLSFINSCCHASSDCWRSLRDLVDVVRLGRWCTIPQLTPWSAFRPVLKTCCVASELTESSLLNAIACDPSARSRRVALHDAMDAQLRPCRSTVRGRKWICQRVKTLFRKLNSYYHPEHFFSTLFYSIITSPVLLDRKSGRYYSFLQIFMNRLDLLMYHLGCRDRNS
ncbi:nucleotidyltransferase family protein [Synechococcus sp. ROS8604]|uniref:nucleotidyltransferase family protein n=1 Tax=Synechococcus sp. ROS8604 TaxID=1442557 RepID=UPI0016468F90|nr:nucleotidyltransferase family protein [Synechococcus sp. ROS8604]